MNVVFKTYVYPEDIKESDNNMLLLKEKQFNYYKMFTSFAEKFNKFNIGLIICIFFHDSDQPLQEFKDDRSYCCIAYNKYNQMILFQSMNWRKLNYWWKIFSDGVDYGYHMKKPIIIKHMPRINKTAQRNKTKYIKELQYLHKLYDEYVNTEESLEGFKINTQEDLATLDFFEKKHSKIKGEACYYFLLLKDNGIDFGGDIVLTKFYNLILDKKTKT